MTPVWVPDTLVLICDLGRGAVPNVDEHASTQTVHQLITIMTVRRN
jgi:hypothetical protein